MFTRREAVAIAAATFAASLAPIPIFLFAIPVLPRFNGLATLMAAIALEHTLILGWPTYFVLRRARLFRWWVSILTGFLMGWLTMPTLSLVYAFCLNRPILTMGDYYFSLGDGVLGAIGACCAFIAWIVWYIIYGKNLFLKAVPHETPL